MSYASISVIGLGYIGLPTAALIASRMHNVIGVDVDQGIVSSVNSEKSHTVEPGLAEMLTEVTGKGWLRAVTVPEPAGVFIIAVPTPITDEKKPDLSYVRAAALSLAPVLRKGALVILESTSPVGTTEQVSNWLAEARPDLTYPHQGGEDADVQIAYCPERILPGNMLQELVNNDRVVGGLSQKATTMAVDLYKIFVRGQVLTTNARTAELCKLAENSFRDVNIAFANELSMICDKLNIDVWELIKLANRHPRVNILQPGCGVGGHCIPVDPWFIVDSAPEDTRLIRTAREVNDHKPEWAVEKVKQTIEFFLTTHPEKKISDITIACLGLAYKPNTDDLRKSPAVDIITEIKKLGCKTIIVDPNIHSLHKNLSAWSAIKEGLEQTIFASDIMCIIIAHKQFLKLKTEIENHNNFVDFTELTHKWCHYNV